MRSNNNVNDMCNILQHKGVDVRPKSIPMQFLNLYIFNWSILMYSSVDELNSLSSYDMTEQQLKVRGALQRLATKGELGDEDILQPP